MFWGDAAVMSSNLQNGDRLSRPEFERRYQAMPHLKADRLSGQGTSFFQLKLIFDRFDWANLTSGFV